LTVQRPSSPGSRRAPYQITPSATPAPPAPPPAPVIPTAPVGVVDKGRFTGRYGVKRSATHIHRGIDISAKRGTPLRAVNDGVVIGLYPDGQRYGYGNSLLIQHPDGKLSFYAHMDRVTVSQGQRVSQGAQIGTVGSTQKRIRGGKVQPNPRPHMPPHVHHEIHLNLVRNPRGVPVIGEHTPKRMDPLVYMKQVGSQPVSVTV
jgi:murein DD-endopeptidase MepM/ murein hydrolase activator NlpD